MTDEIYPSEEELFAQVDEGDRWEPVSLLDKLKAKARAASSASSASESVASSGFPLLPIIH
jgi:hypothetical protein